MHAFKMCMNRALEWPWPFSFSICHPIIAAVFVWVMPWLQFVHTELLSELTQELICGSLMGMDQHLVPGSIQV